MREEKDEKKGGNELERRCTIETDRPAIRFTSNTVDRANTDQAFRSIQFDSVQQEMWTGSNFSV